ncbi:MAG TPA: DUF1127 domain-containing protein [Candidatus Angelobacter sp.]|nr:DUF1127 domain-containing protein [Candidatus Angelobacter sp.]
MNTTLTSKCSLAGAAGTAAPRRAGSAAPITQLLLDLLSTWLQRARERRALHALDDGMLKDIGLTRADIDFEAHKPFWRD